MTDDTIYIRQTRMIHATSTKFYQIYQFRNSSGRVMCLTHWGKANGDMSEDWRPARSGQTQLKEGYLETEIVTKKQGRDYRCLGSQIANNMSPNDGFWIKHFGVALAHELMTHLAPSSLSGGPTVTLQTTVIGETTAPEPEDRPAHWGSW